MAAGFQSFFPSGGSYQIDADIRVATLAYRVDFTGPFISNQTPFVTAMPFYFDIEIPSNVASLFFQSPGVDVTIGLISRVGNVCRFKCSAQTLIRIYGYADQNIPDSRSGFQTLNQSGIITFDSNAKPFRPAAIYRGAASGTTVGWPGNYEQYAAGIGNYPKRGVGAAQAGVPFWIQMSYCVQVGPSSAGVGELPVLSRPVGGAGVPPPAATPAMQAPNLMIINVDGH